MTLEDFFTLTEIKDGLTAISRVEELVSVMQKSQDSVVKNAGDASRQWTSVASTIAATKNKECLDAFIHLDGLFYFSRWLIDAQRLASDSTKCSIEEAILALLQALENLGVDGPKLVYSGIWHTVKTLVDHGSSRIQDLARKLFDRWKQANVCDRAECNNDSIHRLHEDETRVIVASGESSGQVPDADPLGTRESNNDWPPPGVVDEAVSLMSGSSEENQPDEVKGMEPQNDKVGINSNVISYCSTSKAEASDGTLTDEIMDAVKKSLSVKGKDSMKDTSGSIGSSSLPAGTSGLLHTQHDSVGRPLGTPPAAEISKGEKQIGGRELSTEGLGASVVAATSSSVEPVAMSSDTAVASSGETKKEPLMQKRLDSKEPSRNSSGTLEGAGVMHNCSKQVALLTDKGEKYDCEALSGLSGDHDRHRKNESFRVSIHVDDEVKKDDNNANSKKIIKQRKKHSSRSMTVSQRLGAIDKSTADIELGIVDALEVAAKVAQEVAREVDSTEPSFDSSEELSEESGQSGSSDSINEEQDTLGEVYPSKEALVIEKHCGEAPQGRQDHLDLKDNTPENGMSGNEIEPCHGSAEKSPCNFDLNEEIGPDNTDVHVSSVPTPTLLVTVSRPVAATRVPPSMVSQLEGTVGWKGSAATSAFHPALPHKVSGGDLREKQVCLSIDLNVAEGGEGGDDKIEDSTPWRQFPFSSNVQPVETTVEAKPMESGRFKLDLNCMNEEDDTPPSELRMETRLFLNRNCHQGIYPASSSAAQQSVKKVNIDLNDGSHFLIDSSDHGPYHGRHSWSTIPHRGHKSDDSVISILGAKVEVNRKDSLSAVSPLLPNGKSLGNSLGLAPSFSYSPSPAFGYNGLTATPGLSFSSPMYAPGSSIPYMMNSSGAPVTMPQVIGSAPHIQPAYTQPHFFMNMPGASHSPNGLASVKPNFDRSSGFGVQGANRETLSLRQFLSPGQSGSSIASAEPSSDSSIVGGKRKEPETGWEPYTLNSKPQFPPWR